MRIVRSRQVLLALFLASALALGAFAGLTDRRALAQDPVPADIVPASGVGEGAVAPDTVLISKEGRFVFDPNWEFKLGARCNIIGELQDCNGDLINQLATDEPEWSGWQQLDGEWIRSLGELVLLSDAQCGVYFNVIDPSEHVRRLDDPCASLIKTPTATPVSGQDPPSTRVCVGPSQQNVYEIRAGSDDVEWSPQQGLNRTGSILNFGGSQVFDPIVGLRFSGVAITRNARVFSARFRVAPAALSGIDVDQRIYGVDLGNLTSWGSVHPGNAPRTTANSLWEIRDQWQTSSGCNYVASSSIAGSVQEIVDRFDWSRGNALAVVSEWEGPFAEASQRPAKSLEGGCAPQLVVSWCPAAFPTATPFVFFTPQPTSTKDPSEPTATPTAGAIVEPTDTPTPKEPPPATATPTEPGPTPTDTDVPDPTATETAVPDPTATSTSEPVVSTPTPTAGTEPPEECDQYDLNGDGRIDIHDLDIIIAAFGTQEGDPDWNPVADVNNDGVVDIADLRIVREWQEKCEALAGPE